MARLAGEGETTLHVAPDQDNLPPSHSDFDLSQQTEFRLTFDGVFFSRCEAAAVIFGNRDRGKSN